MAAPMRPTSSQDPGHRPRVADSNFEYDDNEWDIGIGDLIIDLDADIEKTDEGGMASNASPSAKAAAAAKMAVEHSATVDKGLKMKIKRTKPGTKSSEAKHEIVKSNEQQNGGVGGVGAAIGGPEAVGPAETNNKTNNKQQHPVSSSGGGTGVHVVNNNAATAATALTQNNATTNNTAAPNNNNPINSNNISKRGSSGHRRDKKHSSDKPNSNNNPKVPVNSATTATTPVNVSPQETVTQMQQQQQQNGIVRVSAPVSQRPVFPASSTGPGPPTSVASSQQGGSQGPSPGPPASPAAATGSAAKPEQAKVSAPTSAAAAAAVVAAAVAQAAAVAAAAAAAIPPTLPQPPSNIDDGSSSPPPAKKIKTEPKETNDVCVGTSVGTITEPDCLGPCEPGTSVTLEGIVWHETEGGVLVVNVTWRGKTYVGTLLDCTRHDWAPPRFCDSPTSDLDTRTPKGRGKRGRSAAGAVPSTDLSNFTETRSSVHSKLRNGGTVKGRRGGAAAGTGSAPPTAPSSPTPFIPPRPEPSNKRKGRTGEEESPTPVGGNGKKTKVMPVVVAPPPVAPIAPIPPVPVNSIALAAAAVVVLAPVTVCTSPPPSPVLLECPEPNCSKKYKHINGLKYHQSHAHGGDDDESKDVTSTSENDESNIEAPSPVTPTKSPDKSQDSTNTLVTPPKKDELPILLRGLDIPSQISTPRSTPPSPQTPQSLQEMVVATGESPTVPETKILVKSGVLRFGEEFPPYKPPSEQTLIPQEPPTITTTPLQPIQQIQQIPITQTFTNQLNQQSLPIFTQPPPTLLIPTPNPNINIPQQISPSQSPKPPLISAPPPQFKVKPTAALMPPDDKQLLKTPNKPQMPASFKKKNRKSPAGSPDPPTHANSNNEQQAFGMEQTPGGGGRDEVQSPAYSDISDDGAPVLEQEDKNKSDKKIDNGQPLQHMPQYGMYPYYGQPPYLVPSVQQQQQQQQAQEIKLKENEKIIEKQQHPQQHPQQHAHPQQHPHPQQQPEKEIKKDINPAEYQQQKVMPQHYYPYHGYIPSGYPYNMDPTFGSVPVHEEKIKEERIKENQSPIDQPMKIAPIPNPIQVPIPGKVKQESMNKDHQKNDNHQILKESIEMKSQMSPYVYPSRQNQQTHHNQQREQDVRRFYVFDQHSRKEQQHQQQQQQQQQEKQQNSNTPNKISTQQSPSLKHSKESIKQEEKKEKEIKQEGVKPTMETQGPPPPPTSQQYYIHPSYMQSPHYGALPFDPNHPMYRGIMVPGPYGSNHPYLHPQMPRYHGPEDLSRAQPPTKALDMLQHHAQYYSSHKIHELQERAIKSPTPKTSVASSSPSAIVSSSAQGQIMAQQPVTTQAGQGNYEKNNYEKGGGYDKSSYEKNNYEKANYEKANYEKANYEKANYEKGGYEKGGGQTTNAPSGKQATGDPGKDSRSPPPQRHVHTHHHTHVGLGYPVSMYPAPYGAAVIASQQAASVTVINPYPPK